MDDQIKVTTAVAAGYLLGRTKQGKRALRLALWLGGGRGTVAANLAQQAKTGLVANPAIAALLAQIRGPLTEAARAAVTSALENRANSLADALQSRTAALSLPGGAKVSDIIDADDNEAADDEDGNAEADEDEAPKPNKRRSRTAATTRTTKQTTAATGKKPRGRATAATGGAGRSKRDTGKTAGNREPAERTTRSRQSGATGRGRGSTRSGTTRRGSTR